MIDWQRIDTVFLDMDGTLLDLNFDTYFWMEHVPRRFSEKHGVELVSVNEQFDTSAAIGRAFLAILMVVGALESDLASERMEASASRWRRGLAMCLHGQARFVGHLGFDFRPVGLKESQCLVSLFKR